jgi:hypothetical protein
MDVDREPDAVLRHAVAPVEEAQEQGDHVWIRIREADLVAAFGSLRPEQHAAAVVKRVPGCRQAATVALGLSPAGAGAGARPLGAAPLAIEDRVGLAQCLLLLRRERHVADPATHARG